MAEYYLPKSRFIFEQKQNYILVYLWILLFDLKAIVVSIFFLFYHQIRFIAAIFIETAHSVHLEVK